MPAVAAGPAETTDTKALSSMNLREAIRLLVYVCLGLIAILFIVSGYLMSFPQ